MGDSDDGSVSSQSPPPPHPPQPPPPPPQLPLPQPLDPPPQPDPPDVGGAMARRRSLMGPKAKAPAPNRANAIAKSFGARLSGVRDAVLRRAAFCCFRRSSTRLPSRVRRVGTAANT